MSHSTYKVFNLHFFKQCETIKSPHTCHNNLPINCESSIHYTNPLVEAFSSTYICICTAVDTHRINETRCLTHLDSPDGVGLRPGSMLLSSSHVQFFLIPISVGQFTFFKKKNTDTLLVHLVRKTFDTRSRSNFSSNYRLQYQCWVKRGSNDHPY